MAHVTTRPFQGACGRVSTIAERGTGGGLSPHFLRQVLQPPSPPPAPGDSGLLPFLSPASPRMWPVPQSLGTAVLELGLVSRHWAGVRGPRAAPTPRPPAFQQHLPKEENRQPQGKQAECGAASAPRGARVRLSPAVPQVALFPAPEPAGGAGSSCPEVAARGSGRACTCRRDGSSRSFGGTETATVQHVACEAARTSQSKGDGRFNKPAPWRRRSVIINCKGPQRNEKPRTSGEST